MKRNCILVDENAAQEGRVAWQSVPLFSYQEGLSMPRQSWRSNMRLLPVVAMLVLATTGLYAQSSCASAPPETGQVVFVCEHGSNKSLIAMSYFNRRAQEFRLPYRAIARGTALEPEVPGPVQKGLAAAGFDVSHFVPRRLDPSDLVGSALVVSFDQDITATVAGRVPHARWDGLPAVSTDYARGRDAIVTRVDSLVAQLAHHPARELMERPSGISNGVPVEAVPVELGTLTVEAHAIGTLRAEESVTIRPEIPGRVLDIGFREGQAVRQGDMIITLDPAEYQAQLAESAATTKLNQLNHERAHEMLKKRLTSQQEYDEALARLQVSLARQTLDQVRLDKTRLRAPFAGVLGLRKVSPGDYVDVGQDIVNLEAINTIKLDFRIPEIYLAQVKPGQQVKVQVDAFPNKSFTGEVYAIDPGMDEATRTIQLRARIPNTDRMLRPGMFAGAVLVLERREDTLLVPEQAIVPMGDNQFVFRVETGNAVLTRVELGQRREGKVEIRSGLDRGDVVITAGQMPKVRDGTPVTVIMGPESESRHQAREHEARGGT